MHDYCSTALPSETFLHNQYRIGSVLGHGGTGYVYEAWDTLTSKQVAIKELFPHTICKRFSEKDWTVIYSSEEAQAFAFFRANFLHEAKLMQELSKFPNLPAFYSAFEENGTIYIVQELLDGYSLNYYLKAHSMPLPEKEVTFIAKEVLYALSSIHKLGYVHRDICCENILLTFSGRVFLIDLGAACRSGCNKDGGNRIVRPGYSPPEQYEAQGILGPWSDIYAVGAVMYRTLTNQRLQPANKRIHSDELKPPRFIKPNISHKTAWLIKKALSLDKNERFQTTEIFLRELSQNRFLPKKGFLLFIAVSSIFLLTLLCVICLHIILLH